MPDTLRWMADHDLPTSEIHIRFRKYLVDCDVYLDDSPIVLPELVEHRPAAMVCRMVRPWNGPVVGAHDVADWPAFAAFVGQIGRRGRSPR